MVGTTHLSEDKQRIAQLEKENLHLRQVNGRMAEWGGTLQAELISANIKMQEKDAELTDWMMRAAEQPKERKRKIYPVDRLDELPAEEDEPKEG